ncbi:MAG: hypothetical protein M3Q99_10075 [Acidobacteriota bacterium]|nr:hypothetical protein [Acidobacteriota bacterium]
MMNNLDAGYSRGVMHSIHSIIEAGSPESVVDELRQYEKRFESNKTESEQKAKKQNKKP